MRSAGRGFWTLVGLGALAVVVAGFAVLGIEGELAAQLLRENDAWLRRFASGSPVLASLLFVALYAVAVAISLPGANLLTVIGGYLFGWLHGSVCVLAAVMIGACPVFLLAQSALGGGLRARAGARIQHFADGFRRHGLTYAVVLNLVPIFPYLVVITVPAACGVPFRVFVAGMFIGVLPATVLLARLGAGMDDVLARAAPLHLSSFMTAEIFLPLVGLALLALLSLGFQELVRRRKPAQAGAGTRPRRPRRDVR